MTTTERTPDSGRVPSNDGLERLTPADNDALDRMPTGWFSALDLDSMIHRPAYRCERLEGIGVLESRVVGVYPHLRREYRLRSNAY